MSMNIQYPAEVNLKILASLEVGKWSYLNKISEGLARFDEGYRVYGSRLKLHLAMLKDVGCILDTDDWNELTKQEQEDYMKRDLPFAMAFKEKNVKNIYQITPTGTEKFEKIRDVCLDRITQRILHIRNKLQDL